MAALAVVCQRYGIAELSAVGSAASGQLSPGSDIDIRYVPREGEHLGWAIDDLADELEHILGRPVDLVAKPAPQARMREAVLSAAKVVDAA